MSLFQSLRQLNKLIRKYKHIEKYWNYQKNKKNYKKNKEIQKKHIFKKTLLIFLQILIYKYNKMKTKRKNKYQFNKVVMILK